MTKGDLISRQAVNKIIDKWLSNPFYELKDHIYEMTKKIHELPSVENKGEWIDDGFYADGHSQHAYRCSECDEHYIGYVGEFKYCPNCGADMRGAENE